MNKPIEKEKIKLTGHGDWDIIFMLKYSKNKRKLANQLAWNYWPYMTITQKSACTRYMKFFDRWKIQSYFKYETR